MTKSQFSLFKSFRNAFNGLKAGIVHHRNIKWMLSAALISVLCGFYFGIEKWEWLIIIICISVVLALELINTSIEDLLDHLHPQHHESVGRAKDIAAAAVLLACIFSAIAGAIIFIPYLSALL